MIEGEEGTIPGRELDAQIAAEEGIHVFSDEGARDVLEEIPNETQTLDHGGLER